MIIDAENWNKKGENERNTELSEAMDTYGTPAIIEDLFSQLFKKKELILTKIV